MRYNSITLTCSHCGALFKRCPSNMAGKVLNYCSNACRFQPRQTLAERFWAKVLKTDSCWLWTGAGEPGNYGRIGGTGSDRRMHQAHRVSWELHNGPIPDGMFVCHNCPGGDNRRCVNPAHLFLGDHEANMIDRTKKGRTARGDRSGPHAHPERMARGERNGSAKLNAESVRTIRARLQAGGTVASLAREFRISEPVMYKIKHGQLWQHVE